MELVVFAKELLQNAAEHMAGYRLGQAVLRHLDRTLWVVEKCARWAVPPPLDQDERPQPELLRPLPWIFFLTLLVVLRVTRESISLINLVMGKPPLRSADVVMYIQSKRRYLRTLKYTGSRAMRNRVSQPRPWYTQLQSMLELTMCFRRQSHYGNNNTTSHSNNDEVLLTNATSIKSDNSDTSVESDQEVVYKNDSTLTKPNEDDAPMEETVTGVDRAQSDENNFSPNKIDIASSTPEKEKNVDTAEEVKLEEYPAPEDKIPAEEKALPPPDKQEIASPKAESKSFIDNENSMQNQTSPKNEQKIGRKMLHVINKLFKQSQTKTGVKNERRDTDASVTKKPADRTF
ncbi:uncharacterized protein LOC131848957 isoform X4 [Achroia grisella]|uniref:uncharacterized protein LOC131848957 isoform X4 n=1 Tax=Achroia grisella TaxID=688607 RepID=UPI0027D27702|nr:uncharacterized protein LOC131848957 isoform X4 [Achroia grisella]